MDLTSEEQRLRGRRDGVPWRFWGPYLSERQWGTVREDYSDNGDAWSYFCHDQARSRAYRWGEDGLAGHLRRAPAAVLRAGAVERARPDPQGAPVRAHQRRGQPRRGRQGVLLLRRQHCRPTPTSAGSTSTRRRRTRTTTSSPRTAPRSRIEMEYELLDTGVFDDDRYFDVEVEYAKAGRDDLVCRITVHNRGPDDAPIHLLPTLWFRNTWSFPPYTAKPSLRAGRRPRVVRRRAPRARRRGTSTPTRRRDAAVLRQRDQRGAAVGRRRTRRRSRRTASPTTSSTAPPTRQPRRGPARRSAAHVRLVVAGRRVSATTWLRLDRRRRRSARPVRRRRRRGRRTGAPRPTSSTPRSRPPASAPTRRR